MYINSIQSLNFRNYKELNLEFAFLKPINLIIAPNGSGKSNLLEIIYYLTYLRPFRNVLDSELINRDSHFFFIKGEFLKNDITTSISVKYSKTKEINLNNKKIKKHSEIIGILLSVLFSNDDIFIICGSPMIRRKFFDMFISIMDKEYLLNLKKYQILLKHKNFILKTKNNLNLLDIYDEQLSKIIYNINLKRQKIIADINPIFQEKFCSIGMFKDRAKIIFLSNLKVKEEYSYIEIFNKLVEIRNKDIETGYSNFGIHKDNYLFLLNGIEFSKYASLGQMRLASLVLKLTKLEYLKSVTNTEPIILLDDVILELDLQRQKKFIYSIPKENQMFITLTDKNKLIFTHDLNLINEINII
ncbi:MAG TPA: DNA replication and repair protein RecF [Spirochaetota bacterium]|nr:DNA replication and repair protein RecF [Spirochaetota bacterium]